MITHELEVLNLTSSTPTKANEQDDEYNIPLDISDIINICKEYTQLTWQMQSQIETILEIGVEEAIKTGSVQRISLPHIKHFLKSIVNNVYFGDASAQAQECINLINLYLEQKVDNTHNFMIN
jgi:hypothetical protein